MNDTLLHVHSTVNWIIKKQQIMPQHNLKFKLYKNAQEVY